ncbi:MAG: quercetin 2,3-dioxygenase [Thermomicrobiales bacterium]
MIDVANGSVVEHGRDELARSVWYSGYLLTFLATVEETGGAYSLVEEVGRRGISAEPPMHVHSRESEAFYLLEGRMTFWVGERRIEAGPGMLVSLPPGIPHRFALESDEVRVLNLCAPAGFEGFFRELSVPAPSMEVPPPSDEPLDVPRLVETAARYGVEILPPPAS